MRGDWEWGRDANETVALSMNQDVGSSPAYPGGDITPPSGRCSRSWEACLTAVEAVGEPAGAMGVLGGEGMVVTKGAASLKVAELAWEVPGFHAVAAGSKAGPTGLHPDG